MGIGDADLVVHVDGHVRERVTLAQAAIIGDVFVAPVNETGWNEMNEIFLGLSIANRMTGPTSSLLTG
jgi:hypothetical protein